MMYSYLCVYSLIYISTPGLDARGLALGPPRALALAKWMSGCRSLRKVKELEKKATGQEVGLLLHGRAEITSST